jgi:dipeptidyl aminopeptidase/acylaminoacyl peptidase
MNMRIRLSSLSLFFLSFCLFTSLQAQNSSFTLEQVMSSPFPSELVTAKQAPRIAWAFNTKGERNIWIADAPGFQARQITHYTGDDGQAIASVRLTPDGKTVLYARGSELNSSGHVANPASANKEPKQQVWAVEVDGGQPRLLGDMGCDEEGCENIQISPDGQWAVWTGQKHHLWLAPVAGGKAARQLTELRGNEEGPQWSPDGKNILFVSDRRDHSLIVTYDLAPEGIRYIAPGSDRDMFPRWSPDGKQIIFVRTAGAENRLPLIPPRPRPWAIWIANADTGEGKELWHSSNELNGSLPPFEDTTLNLAAGNRILFNSEQDGRNHLYSISASGGQPTLLTAGDFDVEDVTLAPDKTTVLYTSNQEDVDRRHIWRVSVAGGTPQQAATRGSTMEWAPVILPDGKTIACLGSTASSPAMPYYITSSGREMIARNALPADFPSAQLVEPKQVTFQSDDGYTIHGQLFVPHNRTKPGAALIFTHGGPRRQMMLGFHYMYYYHNAYAENQYLASLGYVVLSVNYRLGIMYGRNFREAPNSGRRGGYEYKDVQAGAKYLQSLPYVDKNRIGLWGGSYGGYLTAMGLARNSDIFSAGVDFHGVHDWSVLLRRGQEDSSEGAPDQKEAEKLAFDSSPVATVANWKSPVLLIHGDDDRNVNFRQTTDLVQRLRANHVTFEEIIYPDEIHDFLLWKDWVRSYQATAEFLNRKLVAGR